MRVSIVLTRQTQTPSLYREGHKVKRMKKTIIASIVAQNQNLSQNTCYRGQVYWGRFAPVNNPGAENSNVRLFLPVPYNPKWDFSAVD